MDLDFLILHQMKNGDRPTVERFVRKYYPEILHYLFRGINNTYDVWFNWNLLDQDSDLIYETISSVTGEDILPENNENPF